MWSPSLSMAPPAGRHSLVPFGLVGGAIARREDVFDAGGHPHTRGAPTVSGCRKIQGKSSARYDAGQECQAFSGHKQNGNGRSSDGTRAEDHIGRIAGGPWSSGVGRGPETGFGELFRGGARNQGRAGEQGVHERRGQDFRGPSESKIGRRGGKALTGSPFGVERPYCGPSGGPGRAGARVPCFPALPHAVRGNRASRRCWHGR